MDNNYIPKGGTIMSDITKTDNKDGWMDTVWSATKAATEMMVDYAKDNPFNTAMAVVTGLALSAKAWPIAATCTGLALVNTVMDSLLKRTINSSSLYALKSVWAQSNRAAKSALIRDYILKPKGVDPTTVTEEEMDSMINIMDNTLAAM